MGRQQKRKKANVPPGHETPLDFAVTNRDQGALAMVQEAIQHKQVMLAFQPVVSAADMKTPAFYEGLIRVLDETGRVIPAKDFMGAVEDTETGRQLDCLALELGLANLAAEPSLRLSVNMSARSIGYSRWAQTLKRGLNKRPHVAERLILEISETSAIHVPELVIDFMDELQAKGISFALDDFGSGFTSFRYFKDFFFDILKLDGQFTRNIHNDSENQVIAAGIAAIARSFDMYTVASRVESPEEAKVLTQLGFDCLQGFLFGAPTVSPSWKASKKNKAVA
ncbi:EAL domain, c-di-GMP-specific phosphodiesterase class I (or its enzymatically inactive variant) [Shimia gijangensis]|uniref:EAL domain, c-di-GMP-specific phosphodiesterase class I (Or its enzymatically inactive variant) n=1 Tax=Shimia gijangensis TaxID=1470563 RepID=A0A1M6FGA9_9RHOB|nr:EAL domain-containing protein [Shimia gijangensis]SHI96764.1 EAL domain, c-di-GMP-specific phosphodiesterase class I (or its enzymatically inactive variant) [Shimia gijangensis]